MTFNWRSKPRFSQGQNRSNRAAPPPRRNPAIDPPTLATLDPVAGEARAQAYERAAAALDNPRFVRAVDGERRKAVRRSWLALAHLHRSCAAHFGNFDMGPDRPVPFRIDAAWWAADERRAVFAPAERQSYMGSPSEQVAEAGGLARGRSS
jgi:hypothetical protein